MNTVKKLWKIIVAALLLVPLFAGALGANADEPAPTTAPTTANVTLHKRVFTDGLPEGLPKENTGLIDEDFGGEALEGAEFTVYDVTERYHTAIVGSTQAAAMADVIAAYNSNPASFTALRPAIPTSDTGEALFANLPLKSGGKDAAYLFVETKTPASPTITEKAAPFILAMPIYTAKGSAGNLNTDIHVYPKNITKENKKEMTNANIYPKIEINGVKHPNVQIGDKLSYQLTIQVPSDIAKLTSFVVKDTPGTGMVVNNPANVVVTGLASGYTITAVPGATSLQVALDPTNTDVKNAAGTTITITYDMVLTKDAPVDTSIQNKAEIIINGDTTTTITPPPGVITNGKQFIKKDDHTGKALANAKFKVYRNNGEGATDWAQFVKEGDTYVFSAWGTEALATEVTSGTDGMIRLKGMIEGAYHLKETATPEGYVLRTDSVPFQVSNGQSGPTHLDTVTNVPKGLLPSTGGSGIYAFIIIGAMMMAGAYIWFKRSKEQAEV